MADAASACRSVLATVYLVGGELLRPTQLSRVGASVRDVDADIGGVNPYSFCTRARPHVLTPIFTSYWNGNCSQAIAEALAAR